MWSNFLKNFKKKKTSFRLQDKYAIEEAFIYDGVKYLRFADINDGPTERMMQALTIYNEMEMKCDYDYLKMHVEAFDRIIDSKKQTLKNLIILNENLKERLQLMAMPDYIYKLASVVYFDETENPYSYNFDYNQTKIENWKKDKDILAFFLSGPIKTLIPYLNLDKENIKMFFPVITEIDKQHRKILKEILLNPVTGL